MTRNSRECCRTPLAHRTPCHRKPRPKHGRSSQECVPAGGNRKGYAGYESDPGLIHSVTHTRFRVLSSELARWARRDPLGYRDGTNGYSYAGNCALRALDPMGTISAKLDGRHHKLSGCPYPNVLGTWGLELQVGPNELIGELGWIVIRFDQKPNITECIAGTVHNTPSTWYKAFRLMNPFNGLIYPGQLPNAPGNCQFSPADINSVSAVINTSAIAPMTGANDGIKGDVAVDLTAHYYPDSVVNLAPDPPTSWSGNDPCWPLLTGGPPSFWNPNQLGNTRVVPNPSRATLDVTLDCCPPCQAGFARSDSIFNSAHWLYWPTGDCEATCNQGSNNVVYTSCGH